MTKQILATFTAKFQGNKYMGVTSFQEPFRHESLRQL